ncbi:penicillin acylase family protein [Corynebacterium heidelbergense]|uniref:Penicillin amidase n=1 Tax=Corynebacterium heidelbergense TaxID=2055947 RepID=A0A364V7L2_9CORY|nr:penicillin acylase family protein [Corynebacterium heidelbergense]RAV32611.1 hypothetical protein DLJ54_02585 [Corynebacterium heidelbergense]
MSGGPTITSITRSPDGIPTISADSITDLAHGQGTATAADRSQQLIADHRRLRAASGEPLDRLVGRVGLRLSARRCFERATPAARDFCAAYADGVNGILARVPDTSRWEPWDPIGMMLLSHLLFGAFPETLWRETVRATLGPEFLTAFSHEPAVSAGSNAWFIPSSWSSTGRPILCADPHRLLEPPGPYQQMRLRAPGVNVDGLAFPGFPGVPHFGQTPTCAWVITNAMADSQPLVRLTGQPAAPELPIVAWDGRGNPLGLGWSAQLTGDGGLQTSMELLGAVDTPDIIGAYSHWVDPVNDVLAADRSGRGVRFTAGRVLRLNSEERARPLSLHEFRQAGWEHFPVRVLEAPEAAANERKPQEARLGYSYCPDQRARRIRELLRKHGSAPITPKAAASIAMDTYDEELHGLVGRLCNTSRHLSDWDGYFASDSVDAAAVAAWRHALVDLLCELPILKRLQTGSKNLRTLCDPLFEPWLNPRVRVGLSLPSILTSDALFGFDVRATTHRAAELAAQRFGGETWGQLHGLGGDTQTILAAGSLPGVTDQCLRVPVARVLWDVGNPNGSSWVVPERGQKPLWERGESIPVRHFERSYVNA